MSRRLYEDPHRFQRFIHWPPILSRFVDILLVISNGISGHNEFLVKSNIDIYFLQKAMPTTRIVCTSMDLAEITTNSTFNSIAAEHWARTQLVKSHVKTQR